MIEESSGCLPVLFDSNKKFFESCYLVLLNILDSEIEKRLELVKAGKLGSIKARGANCICSFFLLINIWMGETISGFAIHAKEPQQDKIFALQSW